MVEFNRIKEEMIPKNKNATMFVEGIVKLQAEISKIKTVQDKMHGADNEGEINDFVFKS